MAAAANARENATSDGEGVQGPELQATRLATEDEDVTDVNFRRTTYHIYPLKDKSHKLITTVVDLKSESPISREGRKARQKKKEKARSTTETQDFETTDFDEAGPGIVELSEGQDDAFFLHAPYLSFHSPPKVLYRGKNNHAPSAPIVLIQGSAFWRKYKLQYSSAFATENVLDPRGVVSWAHNGGSKSELSSDDTKLKGYKVRTWRLWGECGKKYVHEVNANRNAGIFEADPDVPDPNASERPVRPAKAEGVVYLEWERPFSRHTRQYHWTYSGADFYWKGTGDVEKTTFGGKFVRFCHLKLVALLPAKTADQSKQEELVLAKYTASVSKKKSGRLEIFDGAVLRLFEEYVRDKDRTWPVEDEPTRVKTLKGTMLYALVVATAICMIESERGKRVAVGEWIEEAASSAEG